MINGDLDADKIIFRRLLTQLIAATSIPFHGEPARGVQVMGVLETRNLDSIMYLCSLVMKVICQRE